MGSAGCFHALQQQAGQMLLRMYIHVFARHKGCRLGDVYRLYLTIMSLIAVNF